MLEVGGQRLWTRGLQVEVRGSWLEVKVSVQRLAAGGSGLEVGGRDHG